MKTHLCCIVSNVKLSFEEVTTVLTQVKSCFNSQPLVALPLYEDEVKAHTRFFIGWPLEALPDSLTFYNSLPLLRRWHLCQALVHHFWKHWSNQYLTYLRKVNKWPRCSRNIAVGDVVLIWDDGMLSTKWSLAHIMEVYPGRDEVVRVIRVKICTGSYIRPTSNIAVLLPKNSWTFTTLLLLTYYSVSFIVNMFFYHHF